MKPCLHYLLSLVKRAGLYCLLGCAVASAETRQEHVHSHGHVVMPFELSSSLHVFRMTASGGVLRVISRDAGATGQIALIQQHLRHEAELFGQGDYSDPALLHGEAMPGLKQLQAGAGSINITYKALADGAEIHFETADIELITALHRWFGAQLSEHGADAQAE